MIDIEGLDHLVLRVADMQRSIDFYCLLLGCQVERRVDSIGLVQLRAGNHLIDLLPRSEGEAIYGENLDHFCLKLKHFDAEQIQDYLKQRGVQAGVTEQRYGAEGYGPSIYIEDPDGNTVELKG
ncbi:MAG: VOC family protein [Motiliproteus sp.]|nr:VOC family protein [Motiliproteus sp.]MCW9051418.1 VOC family protein [Motiliproteus sp.]